LSLAAKYPFTVDFERYVSREIQLADPLLEVLGDQRLVGLALERSRRLLAGRPLEGFIEGLPAFEAVASFYLGLAVAGRASRTLLATLISRELDEASRLLSREREEVVLDVAARLGVRVEESTARIPWIIASDGRIVYKLLKYSMSLWDYVRLLGVSARAFSLANSFILEGRVFLDVKGLKRLVIARAKRKMEEEAQRLAAVDSPVIERAAERLAKEVGPEPGPVPALGGELARDALPKCISDIIEKGLAGDELSDAEFFMLATFIANVRGSPRILAEVLERQLGFTSEEALDVSMKLLRAASSYRPYDCTKMPGSEICGECPGDLVKHYFDALKRRTRRARRAQGR
jgi:DNA primase large subunit